MDIVNTRFEKFKVLINSIPGIDKFYLSAVNSCSATLFLVGLKAESNKTVDELIKQITDKACINLDLIDDSVKRKFISFIEYFMEVSKIVEVKLK